LSAVMVCSQLTTTQSTGPLEQMRKSFRGSINEEEEEEEPYRAYDPDESGAAENSLMSQFIKPQGSSRGLSPRQRGTQPVRE